jgi:diadenylate cyclase
MAAFVRRPLTGWDVADILIVSVLIYEALKLIRGTRAMQMAIGSVLVLFLFYTSRLFPLQTVNWLIRNVLSYGVFAAIIVVEREIGLRNYVESGIRVDALVSYDLLTTIFQPNTPLHDGAVILQEDRIAAAACFLPLSTNPKLDRDLGTRHRAAIGITEECDAVAVVVSEERGEVSLSTRGRLERRLTADQLRARLQALILHKADAGAADRPLVGEA